MPRCNAVPYAESNCFCVINTTVRHAVHECGHCGLEWYNDDPPKEPKPDEQEILVGPTTYTYTFDIPSELWEAISSFTPEEIAALEHHLAQELSAAFEHIGREFIDDETR